MKANARFSALVVAVGLAASGGVVACGDDGGTDDARTASALTRGIVQAGDIAKYAGGSPERALLEWFQAVQFRDVSAAQQLITGPALNRLGRGSFRSAVANVGSSIGRPRIILTRRGRGGRDAVIRAFVELFRPGQRAPAASTPATFLLTNRGGWRLSDLDYLVRSSEEIDVARGRPSARGEARSGG